MNNKNDPVSVLKRLFADKFTNDKHRRSFKMDLEENNFLLCVLFHHLDFPTDDVETIAEQNAPVHSRAETVKVCHWLNRFILPAMAIEPIKLI